MRKLLVWVAIALALLGAAPALATVTSPTVTVTDTATGSSNVFNYGFLIPFQADGVTPAVTVQTVVAGVTTTLTPSQYTIVGVGTATGGTVTINGTNLASGSSVIITRAYAYTQTTAVPNIGFYPHTTEQVADNLEYQIQQLNSGLGAVNTTLANGAVTSFNGRTGTVLLSGADVTGALSFTPASNTVFVAASDFGVSTASNDNSAAFMAIDTAGKVAVLSPGVYKIANTVAFTHSFSGLKCASGAWTGSALSTAVAQQGGCWLQWTGASGGTMMTITAPTGVATNGDLRGNVVKGINFDGNSLAANGLAVFSEEGGNFDQLYFQGISGGTAAFRLDVVHATNGTFAEHCDSQGNIVSNLFIQEPGINEVGVFLGGWSTSNFVGGGQGGCNVSLNNFYNWHIAVGGGVDAVQAQGIDNNHLWNLTVFGSTASIHFQSSVFGSLVFPSNSNTVIGLSSAVAAHADGQTTRPGCIAWNMNGPASANPCTFGNTILQMDKGNNTPDPVVEPGADVIWTNNDGTRGGAQMSSPLVVADTAGAQIQGSTALGSASLIVTNQSNNHIGLFNGGLASFWGINMDSAFGTNANLKFITSGTGVVQLPAGSSIGNTPIKSAARAHITACGAGGCTLSGSTNVASITRIGVGHYTINFTGGTFSSSNYSVACQANVTSNGAICEEDVGSARQPSSYTFFVASTTAPTTAIEATSVDVIVDAN